LGEELRRGTIRREEAAAPERTRRAPKPIVTGADFRQRSGTFVSETHVAGHSRFSSAPRGGRFSPTQRPLSFSDSEWDRVVDASDEFDNPFHITVACDGEHRATASSLLQRRYAW